jgi:hypothetical protein
VKIETRPKIWVSSTKEKKRQEAKTPEKQHKTQKCAKSKRGLMSESPWCTPIDERRMNFFFKMEG